LITRARAAKAGFGGAQTLEPLWQPLTIAGAVIPNRVMTSALTLQYGALRALRPDVYCIGDAVSPRPLEAIIYEAEELARSL
jgi:hypothetical protein